MSAQLKSTQPSDIAQVITLPCAGQSVLATGAWFKNTVCATANHQAYMSQVVGDLDTPEACILHEQYAHALLAEVGETPSMIAHDMHPDFHSTRFAGLLAATYKVPLLAVQHHHAHIAAICAEHAMTSPVLGLALDGVGLGLDGTAWGGELLHLDGATFQRLGHLQHLALAGGDRAAREPWRMGAAALHLLGRQHEIATRYQAEAAAQTVATMLARGLNSPMTSSAGRLFDAVAGLLALCPHMAFEAEAAILLEKTAKSHGTLPPMPNGYTIDDANVLSFAPLLQQLADLDFTQAEKVAHGAALFHATFAAGLVQWAVRAADKTGVHTIALAGGCFLNSLLTPAVETGLQTAGFTVIKSKQLSPGDSAIALGQAWVAMQYQQ